MSYNYNDYFTLFNEFYNVTKGVISQLIETAKEIKPIFDFSKIAYKGFNDVINANDKMLQNQFIFTDSLNADLVLKLSKTDDVQSVVEEYYFGNNGENYKNLCNKCEQICIENNFDNLFYQIMRSADNGDYQLACLGAFSIVDGLITTYAGTFDEKYSTNMITQINKLISKISIMETDIVLENSTMRELRMLYSVATIFNKDSKENNLHKTLFFIDDFSKEDNENVLNRHRLMHCRTFRNYSRIDLLKILLYIDFVNIYRIFIKKFEE